MKLRLSALAAQWPAWKRRALIGLCLALLLPAAGCGLPGSYQPGDPYAGSVGPTTGALFGTVRVTTLDNRLVGLSGAVVTATGPIQRTTTAKADGTWQLVQLPVGTYTVVVSAPAPPAQSVYANDGAAQLAALVVADVPTTGVDWHFVQIPGVPQF